MTKREHYLSIRQKNRDLLVRTDGKLTSDAFDRRVAHASVAVLRGKTLAQVEPKHRDDKDYRHDMFKRRIDAMLAEHAQCTDDVEVPHA